MGFREKLSKITLNYERARLEEFKDHKIAIATRSLPEDIQPLLGGEFDYLMMKGSAGMGGWARVPWCAFLNPLITTSVQNENVVVYLMDSEKCKIYLSLNQGTESVKKQFPHTYKQVLKQRAEEFRNKLEGFSFPISAMDDFKGEVAEGYASGHIYGYEYDASSLPDESVMIENLKSTLRAYHALFVRCLDAEAEKIKDPEEVGNSVYFFSKRELAEAEEAVIIEENKKYIYHRKIERASGVSKAVKKIHGTACECCGVDFAKVDNIKVDISEVHHIIPLASLEYGKQRKYDIEKEFAVLCPNCHRLLHKLFPKNSKLEISDLKTLFNK